jgi:hypothetical protein
VALTWDRCGDGWADLDAEPHFATTADATAFAENAGWIITGTHAVCPDCLTAEACALTGHRWGPWSSLGPFPEPDGSTWQGRVRYCEICTSGQWDPPVHRHGSDREAG